MSIHNLYHDGLFTTAVAKIAEMCNCEYVDIHHGTKMYEYTYNGELIAMLWVGTDRDDDVNFRIYKSYTDLDMLYLDYRKYQDQANLIQQLNQYMVNNGMTKFHHVLPEPDPYDEHD